MRLSEERARQFQKLEAMGWFAEGIVHDFNNLLMAMHGYTELLLHSLSDEDPRRRYAQEILNAGDCAASLTRPLLAFGRRPSLRPRLIDVNSVIGELGELLQRLLGEDVTLALVPGPGLWRVRADRGQLEQMILNLAVHAREAMTTGGRLTLQTANVGIAVGGTQGDVMAGRDYVLLSVGDTGRGPTFRIYLPRAFQTRG